MSLIPFTLKFQYGCIPLLKTTVLNHIHLVCCGYSEMVCGIVGHIQMFNNELPISQNQLRHPCTPPSKSNLILTIFSSQRTNKGPKVSKTIFFTLTTILTVYHMNCSIRTPT